MSYMQSFPQVIVLHNEHIGSPILTRNRGTIITNNRMMKVSARAIMKVAKARKQCNIRWSKFPYTEQVARCDQEDFDGNTNVSDLQKNLISLGGIKTLVKGLIVSLARMISITTTNMTLKIRMKLEATYRFLFKAQINLEVTYRF